MGQPVLPPKDLGDRLLPILVKGLLQRAQGLLLGIGKATPKQPVLVVMFSVDRQRRHVVRVLIQMRPGKSHVTLSKNRVLHRHLSISLDEEDGPGDFLFADAATFNQFR